MRVIVAVLSGLMVGIAAASTDQAFQAGKTLGAGSRQQAASQISAGSATGKVPSYGASAPETNYFQGGRGELSGHGITKMQTCATATPDSDPIKRQECEAVNFLARNPNTRPQFDLSNNPMFDRAKNIRNNAENIFASLGVGGTGSSTQCVPRTITTPAQYSTDTCSSIREVGEQQCTMGRVINIDTDANFQCDKNINAYESIKCRRGSSVTVGFGQCTPGAWLGRVAYMACSWCVDPYMAMNIYCGSDGRSYMVNPYLSHDGVNRYNDRRTGDSSYGYFNVAVAPGQSVVDYYVGDIGRGCNFHVYYSVICGTSTCTPSIRVVSSGCNGASGSGTGAPLQLPLTKTISNWTSDQCTALRARTR